jgi:hypothetical protein
MDGRQSMQRNLPLEQLTAVHKTQGDADAQEGDYISAAGQYSSAINHFLFNNNSEITLPQLYLCRSRAYLETERHAHARCDLYTAMSNMPTAAVLQGCYITLRALYLAENNLSPLIEQKVAQDFKALQPEFYQSLVKAGIAEALLPNKPESFFQRLFSSSVSVKSPKKLVQQAGTELAQSAPSATSMSKSC